MSVWNQYGFPDPVTESAANLFIYHDMTMVVAVMVLLVVGWFLAVSLASQLLYSGKTNMYVYRNEALETFWTVVPMFFLFGLGYISLKNLYEMEVGDNVGFTVQVVGHQWYWEYNYVVSLFNSFDKAECVAWENLLRNNTKSVVDELESMLFMEDMMEMYVTRFFNSVEAILQTESELLEIDNRLYNMTSMLNESDMNRLVDEDINVNANFNRYYSKVFSKFVSKFGQLGQVSYVPKIMNKLLEWMNDYLASAPKIPGFWMKEDGLILCSCTPFLLKGDWYVSYDSYSVPEDTLTDSANLPFGSFRNQSTDRECLLAWNCKNEVNVSTADVMHSWGVSELGVKADAVPGRSNCISVEPVKPGVMYGNCYELCGEGHSQMPITVLVLSYSDIIFLLRETLMGTEEVAELLNAV